MRRYQDWPIRLMAVVDGARKRPFSFGAQDCCLFAADCVRAMTGADFAAGFRGTYRTEGEAAQLLEPNGGVRGLATQALGEPLDTSRLARRGDVVVVRVGQGPDALGVVMGATAVAPGMRGLVEVPMSAWQLAWRV
jgi:hypothetical protein